MKKEKIQRRQIRLKKELPFHIMLLPGVIMTFIFSYIPMAGMVIAFQKFIPAKGLFGDQKWIGFENFTYLFNMPGALAEEYDQYCVLEDHPLAGGADHCGNPFE